MSTTAQASPSRQSARGLMRLARVGWIIVALVTVGLDLYAIPAFYHRIAIPCPDDAASCLQGQLYASGQAQLNAMGISSSVMAMVNVILLTTTTLVFAGLAALMYWRRSDDRMALFCAYMLVTFGGAVVNDALQTLPTSNFVWFFVVTTLVNMGQITFIVFFLLFPDGRFAPRWTRWVALAWSVAWLATYFPALASVSVVAALRGGPLFVTIPMLLIFAQVYRYRRISNARQRQQTKWVVYGFAIGLGAFALLLVSGNVIPALQTNGPGQLIATLLFPVLFSLIPLTISIAILRSRLYDIDIIIRRTLVYGSLTLLLAALYIAGVVGVQSLINTLTGHQEQQSPILIVVTTLAIAALFRPLRVRIQSIIDRRFYRHKYDVTKTLAAFGETLRSEVDLGPLTDRLIGVVAETMQPEHMSLWLQRRDTRKNGASHESSASLGT